MNIIAEVNDTIFSINGIPYKKTFVPVPVGSSSMRIVSAYDGDLEILPSTTISNITAGGVVYASQADLITALISIVFTRINSGFQGKLEVADTPTEDGYYLAIEAGTYSNAGGTVVSSSDLEGKDVRIYKDGSTYTKEVKDLKTVMHTGQTAPSDTDKIWRKLDGSDDFIDFYLYDDSEWISFTELYMAIHNSSTAPDRTWKIWNDLSVSGGMHKRYDTHEEEWVPVFRVDTVEITSDTLELTDTHDQKNLETQNDVIISLGNSCTNGFICTIDNISDSATIVAADSNTLNGSADNSFQLSAYKSVYLRKRSSTDWIVKGDLVE
jgi:hypothetical protein